MLFRSDHLNHNKRDNSLTNLEWVTKEENWRRAESDYIATVDEDNSRKIYNKNYKLTFNTADEALEWLVKQPHHANDIYFQLDDKKREKMKRRILKAAKNETSYDSIIWSFV